MCSTLPENSDRTHEVTIKQSCRWRGSQACSSQFRTCLNNSRETLSLAVICMLNQAPQQTRFKTSGMGILLPMGLLMQLNARYAPHRQPILILQRRLAEWPGSIHKSPTASKKWGRMGLNASMPTQTSSRHLLQVTCNKHRTRKCTSTHACCMFCYGLRYTVLPHVMPTLSTATLITSRYR